MKAAVLSEYGVPNVGEFDDPVADSGQAVVSVLAAGVNPVDIAISAGRFYGGKPQLPCIVGREGVGLLDGTRVYFDAPLAPFGSIAERALIDRATTHAVPDAVPDGVAIALGISGLAAWLALSWRAKLSPGEHVLVLGAGGLVGQVAVQAARLLGAGRVVAAARSQEGLALSRALGADACVPLELSEELPAALQSAAEGRIDVVVDPLFGEPFAAAVHAASFRARLVHLGTAAGPEATLPSAPIRGKMLTIMGHTNFAAPPEVKWTAYGQMLRSAVAGELRVEVDELPLERVAEAWSRVQAGSHRKVVVVPSMHARTA
jgi:NADPH:quinone reductase-like Zn-dependent oxidoreductase